MTIPFEQKEMLLKYPNREDFVKAFFARFKDEIDPMKISGRISTLVENRAKIVAELNVEIAQREEEELQRKAREDLHNHTVMIPAVIKKNRIESGKGAGDSLPDVGETLIRTNNLLAELVQLQKEQIALFRELKGKKGE